MWDRVFDGFGKMNYPQLLLGAWEFLELGRMVEGNRMKRKGEEEERDQIWSFTEGGEEDYSRWGWLRERMKREVEDEALPRAKKKTILDGVRIHRAQWGSLNNAAQFNCIGSWNYHLCWLLFHMGVVFEKYIVLGLATLHWDPLQVTRAYFSKKKIYFGMEVNYIIYSSMMED